tara:strand:+ start:4972 stop:5175 length:204 start_codon:yes stop_codon:yes gene_type:complete
LSRLSYPSKVSAKAKKAIKEDEFIKSILSLTPGEIDKQWDSLTNQQKDRVLKTLVIVVQFLLNDEIK